jgi:hypothetical protein
MGLTYVVIDNMLLSRQSEKTMLMQTVTNDNGMLSKDCQNSKEYDFYTYSRS